MTAPTTDIAYPTPVSKHETAKQWLQRRLRKLPSIHPSDDPGDDGLRAPLPVQRPRTAPCTATATEATSIPGVPPIPIEIPQPFRMPFAQPPSRSARPNSGVMRDVDAWLDTSIDTPSPPLMGGLSYWRKATVANAKNTAGIQHATPIVRKTGNDRPSTSQSQQIKSFRRRAKRMQVQMPLLARNGSIRQGGRKQTNRRSNSTPVFAIAYESTQPAAPPIPILRPAVRVVPAQAPNMPDETMSGKAVLMEQPRFRHDTPASGQTSEVEGSTERRLNTIFSRSTRSADSTRPSTAAARITREDSMGELSDAPSYFSGPPPPSYHSRPASIITTSSFGCVDGMNPAQRQISQQRAAMSRGVKGKLKRFAQNFGST
ncbi:hypothetical protein BDU57DRAFT_523185 [Ampelomyces quisqualis]|uniref:Uncharacterized protein n=1 Tax=Ampelomyces quisqualis TaxID=50730 RepID=A0A6A5Q917_AMPQU|nr:hypothetical protein BDU57DRAFT_523185 [Ampelomyces quisqualis]